MKIELVTMWYNEEFLAPFFLNHYSWVDKIHILLDADTNDNTEQIALSYPNVEIEYFRFPDMMDDIIKARKINEKYQKIVDADYVIVVDSDEYIFCNKLEASVKEHIKRCNKNVYFAIFWQIYEHDTDTILDKTKPVYMQRRHGDPAISSCYIKPAIVRAGHNIVWGYGNHNIVYNGIHMGWDTNNPTIMQAHCVTVQPIDMLQGSHWKLFDLNETIKRRINNRTKRQSHFNLRSNLTYQHHNTKVDDIVAEFNERKHSPVVIKNRNCVYKENIQACRSIFEILLTELSLTDGYECNQLFDSIVAKYLISDDIPEWYPHVLPHTSLAALAEDLFSLACSYRSSGEISKAIHVLQKALQISPNSLHYRVYLKDLQHKLEL